MINGDMLLFALNASFAHQALGVLTIAAYINSRQNSHCCDVLECNINERDDEIFYKLYIKTKDKKIAGFSCYIWNTDKMLKFAENLKKLIPDIYIVFGGPEVSYCSKQDFLELYPFVDFLIQGEGETALLGLYNDIDKERFNFFDNISHIENLYSTAGNYHTVYYESSRGCPFNCSYCISGIEDVNQKVRAKDIDVVLHELKFIEDKYYLDENSKINIIKFCDRTFNFSISRANKLYKNLIERAFEYIKKYGKRSLPYQFEIYPTLFDEESFEILKDAPDGLFQMEIGVQSLNPQTLDAIGRVNFDAGRALENIAKIKNLGNIHVHVDLIVGLPYESLNSFINGFNALYEKTGADFIQIGFLKLLKGTRIREEAESHGYRYETASPYTVLQNRYMNFEDIMFLRDIEKIYKRYSSEAYARAFYYIYKNYFPGNVFGILKRLALYWRNNNLFDRQISQKDAFAAFYETFKNLPENMGLCEMLEKAFYMSEGKRLNLKRI
ncbi:MAG: B12-binding domain-containing radical SAM protein [Oscillospiraceae bacterium]|nr:B12-binding domain-containing radical SAM protein [Oscillospiraceae bacterium]